MVIEKRINEAYELCIEKFTSSDVNSYVRKISKIYLDLLVLYSTINCFDSLFFVILILIILMFIVFTEARTIKRVASAMCAFYHRQEQTLENGNLRPMQHRTRQSATVVDQLVLIS